ncbi:MAG: fibronectin type III domain-containing protein [Gemmatimonadales bacterium]
MLAGVLFAGCGDETTDPTPDTVATPTGVAAVATSTTSIRVTWNQVSEATGYELDRAPAGGAFSTVQTALTATTFEDTGLNPATQYRYQVRAVKGSTKSTSSTEVAATTLTQGPKVATITGVTLSRTLYADTVYTLSGFVKVSNGATLTIQAGTKIVGDTLVPGSSLWILRGAKISANGTAASPIVFTSARSAGNRAPGDWGGIVIVGNAPINRTADPIFTEGPTGAAENYAAGTNFNDDSGNLTYVRVEFAGYDVSGGAGQELNSVSSYAVGRGTQYDYVQSMAGLDDSFEFFGGGVDVRHMVSFEAGDDHFDWTEGYRGRGQYLIALQTSVLTPRPGTGTVSSDPRGFEGDGCENDKAGCTYANAPYSQPVWANFTVIGPGTGVFSTTDGNAAVVRRGGAANFVNGILARWPGVGFSIRNTETKTLMDADSLYIRNVYLVENGSNFEAPGANFGSVVSDSAAQWNVSTALMNAVFQGALPTAATAVTTANLNLGLVGGAAAATAGLASFAGTPLAARVTNFFGGTMAGTAYVGAADPAAANWYEGWTNWVRN